MIVSWDQAKNIANQRKHGVSFELAQRVFDDPLHLSRHDRIESGEYRWQTLGLVDGGILVLFVAHTWHEDEEGYEHIRIISARRASSQERKIYEQAS